jgi:hypothetical protein
MDKCAIHYVASTESLGTHLSYGRKKAQMTSKDMTCPHVSAGHDQHEYTTGCSWPMI